LYTLMLIMAICESVNVAQEVRLLPARPMLFMINELQLHRPQRES